MIRPEVASTRFATRSATSSKFRDRGDFTALGAADVVVEDSLTALCASTTLLTVLWVVPQIAAAPR
ncbi:MAG: hypothetical protein L0H93_16460 [Nocardioides sp.]|nr:hypothetical protein [Nocardioides sp.]